MAIRSARAALRLWRALRIRHQSKARLRAARLLFGTSDLPPSAFPQGHYYSTIPSVQDIEEFRQKLIQPPPSALPGIDLNLEGQRRVLAALKPFYDEHPFLLFATPDLRYQFTNDLYPCADAIILYCMLRYIQPSRLIEVGSGWSTCVTLDTAERFLDKPLALTLIEPYPDRLLQLVRPGDLDEVELRMDRLQDVPLSLFETLESGDVLFVDSTHVAKTGSDVNRLMFEVLPRLAAGVHIHIHDVHYPFEYPQGWVEHGWAWNETFLVHAFLQYNGAFSVEFFTDMLRKRETHRLATDFPLLLESPGVSDPRMSPPGSLWLRKNE